MPDTEAFVQMTSEEADKHCGVEKGFYPDNCPVCKQRVIIHCGSCKVQVSGCLCILATRVAEKEHTDRVLEEIEREESLRAQLADKGMWLPPLA